MSELASVTRRLVMAAMVTMRGMTMKTPARSENSVQFSLGELLKLEDERVAEEGRERDAHERAEIQAKMTAAREARSAEEAAEAQRRRTELDELARREAMQKAAVEQARLEVEARTRADERERERQHEIALSQARAAVVEPKPAGLGPLLAATGLGSGLMLLVTCVVHFAVTQPTADRRLAELELRATTAEQRVTEADTAASHSRKRIALLEQKVATLDTENRDLKSAAAAALTTGPRTPKAPPVPHPPPAKTKVEADCVSDHDPMCFKIR